MKLYHILFIFALLFVQLTQIEAQNTTSIVNSTDTDHSDTDHTDHTDDHTDTEEDHDDHEGHDHDDHGDEGEGNPDLWKGFSIIFTIALGLFGLIPVYFESKIPVRSLSFLNSCAGGIFFSVALIHMYTEGTVELQAASGIEWLPPFAFTLGFSIVFFLEKVLLMKDPKNHTEQELKAVSDEEKDSTKLQEKKKQKQSSSASKEDDKTDPEKQKTKTKDKDNDAEELHVHVNHSDILTKGILGYVVVIVVSFHSFVAGATLGIGETETDVTLLLLSIATHKIVESLAIGASLTKVDASLMKKMILVLLYTSIVPIGICIGWLIESNTEGEAKDFTFGFLLCFGAGAFIYIAVVDIMLDEISHHNKTKWDTYFKFALFIIGIVFMSILVIAFHAEHDHGDDHSGHDH